MENKILSKLKPCPFCGEREINISFTPKAYWIVQCLVCEALVFGFKIEAKAIKTWNNRADSWIDVKDKLPDNNNYVFCYSDDTENSYEAFFMNGLFIKQSGEMVEDVTHWQPLPEPPRRGKS